MKGGSEGLKQWLSSDVIFKYDIETGYGHERDRHIAYAAELLTSYFFLKKKRGLKLAVTDYRFLENMAGGQPMDSG